MLKSIQRHREFTGPTPHSVAILARPTNRRPAEHLILERRRIEDLREQSIAETKYNKQCDLKSAWERATDKRIKKNVTKRGVELAIRNEEMQLELRREKLREMLLAEEENFLAEMERMEETIGERQLKMKTRANELKQIRERERLSLVEAKLDQKFREECEELRAQESKRRRDQIFADRKEQIKIKKGQELKEAEVENFFAKLWDEDTKAKALREEFETQQQIERNRSALEVLNIQKKAIETQREEEKLTKQMEAEWLKEEAALRAYEEEELKKEKKEKQRAARRARDISMKLKKRKEEKEKQEQIALDMKILEKILEDTQNQAVDDLNKKKQMREEMQRFMHYVDKTRHDEMEREKQIEYMINEAVNEQWKKKDERKKMEKQARKILMDNVLQTRQVQIKDRAEALRIEQESALKEREEMLEQMREHRKLESEKINRIRMENKKYQSDLEEQISYQRKLKEKEIEDARKELEMLNLEEIKYQKRLRSALEMPDRSKMHPLRIMGTASQIRAKSC